jgi:sporulation protein YlmC with PRC-barrel domain
MLKKLMITTAMSGLMIGAAMAQATPPAQSTPEKSAAPAVKSTTTGAATSDSAHFVNAQSTDQWLSSKFIGTDVIGTDDKKIGDVSDVLLDQKGTVVAYVVGVGGFLGIGEKNVALAPTSFELVPGKDPSDVKLRLSMTKDQLQQAANFEPYKPPRATTGAAPTGGMNARPGGAPSTNR